VAPEAPAHAATSSRLRPIEACPVCGAAERRPRLFDPVFPLAVCASCGHVYGERLLEASVLAEGYYDEPDADLAVRSMAAKEARFLEYQAMLRRHGVTGGRVLDVGCNAGDLLTLFQRRGWEVAGVEPSPGPAAFARARRGLLVWTGTVDALPEHERFDLVTMSHVLEHVPRAVPLLERLRRALRPGGHLLIEVPNVDDPLLRLWGRHYRPLCLGDHVSFFSPRSLRDALARASFAVADEASPTHARDVVYPSLLSAVDWVRGLRPRPPSPAAPVGVEAQVRYRGALRAPLRKAFDALTDAIDPAVVRATRGLARAGRGACLIVLARPA
jgi:2-polyprenyl-3-methyl-5-hydroxy-6-metoxy-1,4-benzoquinol methylase